jgi:hypothetical protein
MDDNITIIINITITITHLVTSRASGVQHVRIVPATVYLALATEVDVVHQQLPARGACETARVPNLPYKPHCQDGRRTVVQSRLAPVTRLQQNTLNIQRFNDNKLKTRKKKSSK